MNNRRKLVIALGAGAFVMVFTCFAHGQGKPVRVGILAPSTAASNQVQDKAFLDAMRELGWVEGRNIVYERAYADGDVTRLPALADAMVARRPDLIYAGPAAPVLAALGKTRTIPIVFGSVSLPVEYGLIQSLAHPGGNVTGVANIGPELGGKRMQLLKVALPKITRIGVLVNPSTIDSNQEQKLIEQAAATLHVTVVPVIVKEANELDAAFASLPKARVEALLPTHLALHFRERKRIMELAAKQRLPVVGMRSEFADDGALMSYSALLTDQIHRAAQLVDKVLKGANPADIPVEQPTKFELVVNKRTAKLLGITIPDEIMLQATKVIE